MDVGIVLKGCGPGWCETTLALQPRHLQQDAVVHAGVLGTMADHTAGGAGMTLMGAQEYVLTVEYKINLLRPATGSALFCRAEVLKPGSAVTVCESMVYAGSDAGGKLVAKATVTLAVMKKTG
ncbi:MAG: PaaI family thioesterase [Spirochaetes bacterium]|nr:MAG: PaaI family thioesterase [Spirochaetota bacterium]